MRRLIVATNLFDTALDDIERNARGGEQLSTPRRTGGEYQCG
jgi:hypothetical protein